MITIIIPVLNEVAIIGEAIQAVYQQRGDYEVIVVDGGSTDGACEIVARSDAQLVRYPAGAVSDIGRQINLGASNAKGDVLMFLHCDVRLPPDAVEHVEWALTDPRVIGGGFVPAFTDPISTGPRLRLRAVERVWQARTRRFCWFAGDTAPFIRSDVFRRSGGYPTNGFASDWDFAARLHALGPLVVISDVVRVDSRRHVMNGVLKTLFVTGSVELMYHLGVKRTFLRQWYRKWLPRERNPKSRQVPA